MKIGIDALAQEIRRVDGNHSMGAGALAEALYPFLSAALSALVEEKAVTKAWSQSDAERENTAFHGWWKERGYDDYPVYTLTCQNACHAAWQAVAQRSALVDVPAVESEPVAWQWDEDLINSGRYTAMWDDEPPGPHPGIKNVTPLYASPVRSAIAPSPAEGLEVTPAMVDAAKSAYWHEVHNGGGYSDKCYEAALRAALTLEAAAK